MSLKASVVFSSSNALSSSRAVALRALPYFASTNPVASHSLQPNGAVKFLTTQPTSPSRGYELMPLLFTATPPRLLGSDNPQGQDNERKVKLGKTLRTLQERLPTLLQSPLPSEILSPNISLHLFPSTHPYLPTVSGRVGYIAALWTSPIAWNRVPIIGNLKLQILSERMTSQPLHFSPRRTSAYPEQLVVKWRTADKKAENPPGAPLETSGGEIRMDDILRGTQPKKAKKEFTGLFIFEFDHDGKVVSHTIEHLDQSGDWEKGMGAKVVNLTDWLLGGIKGREPQGACPMFETTGSGKGPRLR